MACSSILPWLVTIPLLSRINSELCYNTFLYTPYGLVQSSFKMQSAE